MVTSLTSPSDKHSWPDLLLCCLIGTKFGDLNPVSFILLIASSSLTQGQGSHSNQIIRAALIKWELGCPQTSKSERTRPVYSADFHMFRGLNVTQHRSVLRSFRHLQLMTNCE